MESKTKQKNIQLLLFLSLGNSNVLTNAIRKAEPKKKFITFHFVYFS